MKFPKNEIVWMTYCDSGQKIRFFMTSKMIRDYYYLYEVYDDESYKKLGKSKSPSDLEVKYRVNEKIGASR